MTFVEKSCWSSRTLYISANSYQKKTISLLVCTHKYTHTHTHIHRERNGRAHNIHPIAKTSERRKKNSLNLKHKPCTTVSNQWWIYGLMCLFVFFLFRQDLLVLSICPSPFSPSPLNSLMVCSQFFCIST